MTDTIEIVLTKTSIISKGLTLQQFRCIWSEALRLDNVVAVVDYSGDTVLLNPTAIVYAFEKK